MSKRKPASPAAASAASAADPRRSSPDTDGMLAEWGARLFYPVLKGKRQKDGGARALPALASVIAASPHDIRSLVRRTVAPGATQVMVKITGGGRGMKAIAAHFRYVGRLGKEEAGGKGQTLELEDERGDKIHGKEGLERLADDWQVAGAYIPDDSPRREAYNVIFSMPPGTSPEAVRSATAEAARELFEGHKYVFVLHEEQGAPHVHLAVRADRCDGVRLNPRKADLDRWRSVFARALQARGINAVATRQPVRAANRNYRQLWEEMAGARGALKRQRPTQRTSPKTLAARADALQSWEQIAKALAASSDPKDVELAVDTVRYLSAVAPGGQEAIRAALQRGQEPSARSPSAGMDVSATSKGERDRGRGR